MVVEFVSLLAPGIITGSLLQPYQILKFQRITEPGQLNGLLIIQPVTFAIVKKNHYA